MAFRMILRNPLLSSPTFSNSNDERYFGIIAPVLNSFLQSGSSSSALARRSNCGWTNCGLPILSTVGTAERARYSPFSNASLYHWNPSNQTQERYPLSSLTVRKKIIRFVLRARRASCLNTSPNTVTASPLCTCSRRSAIRTILLRSR